MTITVQILGKEKFERSIAERKRSIAAAIRETMRRRMLMLADHVRADKLSGKVLRTRTGTLRRSVHARIEECGNKIVGIVGTRVYYARVHEDGGDFLIPEHWRMVSQAWGRPIAPRSVRVGSHTAKFPRRAFLRPSLVEQRDAIVADLFKATRKALL